MVADYSRYVGGSIVWYFLFRRNLADREVSDFTRLLALLDKAYLSIARDVVRLWKPEAKGSFRRSLFFKDMNVSSTGL